MTTELKRHYLSQVHLRYQKGSKKVKSLILDEFCQVCGISRKHAIKLLSEVFPEVPRRPGRKRVYGEDIDRHLRHLWECMGRINSKKMVAAMPIWLPFYKEADESMKLQLRSISSATIDRHLEKFRVSARRGISTTSPSMIKNKIPLKLLDEAVKEPGYLEADTVAHCGSSLAGEFINTLTVTDLYSGWTENRAMWKKESRTVIGAIKSVEESLPFYVKGFASDNVLTQMAS